MMLGEKETTYSTSTYNRKAKDVWERNRQGEIESEWEKLVIKGRGIDTWASAFAIATEWLVHLISMSEPLNHTTFNGAVL